MVISERQVNEEMVVEIMVGRFDQTALQDFQWRIDLAINAGYRHVILNMTDVTFVDSTALGCLVLSQRRMKRIRGNVSIVAVKGFVREILELTEIGEWIPIYLAEEDAIAAIMATAG